MPARAQALGRHGRRRREEPVVLQLCLIGVLARDERIGERGVIDGTQEKLHASAAALAKMRAERQVEPPLQRPFRDHLARHIDGVELELAAADGALARRSRHEHCRASLARRRALGSRYGDEDHRSRRWRAPHARSRRGGSQDAPVPTFCRKREKVAAFAFISSTANSTRSGVAGASRRGQRR